MTTITLSLPDSALSWIEQQISDRQLTDVSEYVQGLINADQRRLAEEQLERQLLHSLDSADPIEATPDWWAAKKQELMARVATGLQS